jgi:type VI protein secretion system component VasK
MFRIGRDKTTPGQRLAGFLIAVALVLLIGWKWTVVGNAREAQQTAARVAAAQNSVEWIERNRMLKHMTFSEVVAWRSKMLQAQ